MFHNRVHWGVSLENADKENKKQQDKKSLSDYLSFIKGIWLKQRETPQCIRKMASLTVEASIILPLIAGFFAFLLFYFRVMQIQLSVQHALEGAGRMLAVLSMKETEQQEDELMYLTLAKGKLLWSLRDDAIVNRYIAGGALGVSILDSEWNGDDIILRAQYVVKIPIAFWGRKNYLIRQCAVMRKWTGWHTAEGVGSIDLNVYVTKYGEVYHMRKSCPYLDLSVQKLPRADVGELRNLNGERYESCEYCGDYGESRFETGSGEDEMVYVTRYGECYHLKMDCSGLKRTIYRKKRSEVEDLQACVKCWK